MSRRRTRRRTRRRHRRQRPLLFRLLWLGQLPRRHRRLERRLLAEAEEPAEALGHRGQPLQGRRHQAHRGRLLLLSPSALAAVAHEFRCFITLFFVFASSSIFSRRHRRRRLLLFRPRSLPCFLLPSPTAARGGGLSAIVSVSRTGRRLLRARRRYTFRPNSSFSPLAFL